MKRPRRIVLEYRAIGIALAHVALVMVSYVCAIFLRFELTFPQREADTLVRALPVLLVCRLVFFSRYHLFSGWWQYVGVRDVIDILKSTTAGSLAFVVLVVLTGAFPGFPRSLWVLEWLLTLQFLAGARVLSRLLHSLALRLRIRTPKSVLIVGSGPIAESTLRELNETPSDRRPLGFLDDGSGTGRGRLRGLPLLGVAEDLPRLLREQPIAEVFITIPSEQPEKIRAAIRDCRSGGVPFRILSSVLEHLDRPRTWDLANLEQLLDVEEIHTQETVARSVFYQKTVLILGAGGPIGSALAWEVAAAQPRHLLLFDRNESLLYYLEVDFLKRAQMVPLTPVIGDLLDLDRLRETFATYGPDLVLHAAAYTRTDLLADNLEEIRENNLGGAENVLRICDEFAVPTLILLSCDESHRGDLACLHRAAEELLRRFAGRGFVRAAVRFPSALGSPGCAVTRAARALQERSAIDVPVPDTPVRIVSVRSITALLVEAFAIARDGDVLAIELGKPQSLLEMVRYLRQVWNLPEVPFQRFQTGEGHAHPLEAGLQTSHPRILRRSLGSERPACVATLLGTRANFEAKGGKLLEDSSSR